MKVRAARTTLWSSAMLLWLTGAPNAAPATAAEWHPELAVTGGARFFNGDLDLATEFAYGVRVSLIEAGHVGIAIDYVGTQTQRNVTSRTAEVDALRALGRVHTNLGRIRPYVIGGIGGTLLDFGDAPDAAVVTLTLGGGAEARLHDRWRAFLEGTFDTYAYTPVTYTVTGTSGSTGVRGRDWMGTLSVGIGAEF